ncbi:MAG: hypothetical protein IJU98_06600 [Synergistaceae bacterium]|nr:hypothetical protein [Synergistaceae bacterium]
MKVDNRLGSLWDELDKVSSARGNGAKQAKTVPTTADEALDLVEAAKESAHQSTMKTWDKHTDMVEKSQQLRQVRDRKEAIERLNRERREDQTELMAQIAIENANRSKMLERDALERQAREMALVA